MNIAQLRFLHTCGFEAQVMGAFFNPGDQQILLEGVCISCSEKFVRNYDLALIASEMREKVDPNLTDKDKDWLHQLHISLDESA